MKQETMKQDRKRLDAIVVPQHPDLTRSQVQSLIMQGKIAVDGEIVTKPGTPTKPDVTITLVGELPKYVSRAGIKMEGALKTFKIDVSGLIILDAGISTGGFTDCLLQSGAKRVYGIDVGYGQVHEKLRTDKRVILLEKTNLRHLKNLPELVDMATLDLSFISMLKVMPAVSKLLKPHNKIIALIKPQFEADREDIRRGGVVKDPAVHKKVIAKIKDGMKEFGFSCQEIIESPITGANSKNKEFLGLFIR